MDRRFDLADLARQADRNVREVGLVALVLSLVCVGVGLTIVLVPPEGAVFGIPWRALLGPGDVLGGIVGVAILVPSMRPSYDALRVGEDGLALADRSGRERFVPWDDPDLRWVITDWRRAPRTRAILGLRLTSGRRFGRGATLSVEAFDTILSLARFKGMQIDVVADRELATRRIEIRPAGASPPP